MSASISVGFSALWLTDITERPTSEGKLYMCAIKDVWSTRIVGYSMSSRMTAALVVSALSNAVAPRDPASTLRKQPEQSPPHQSTELGQIHQLRPRTGRVDTGARSRR